LSGAVTLKEAISFYVMDKFASGAVALEEQTIVLYVMEKTRFRRRYAKRSKVFCACYGQIRFWRRYARRSKPFFMSSTNSLPARLEIKLCLRGSSILVDVTFGDYLITRGK